MEMKPANGCVNAGHDSRHSDHSRQNCEATNRNAIEAQRGSGMSCPSTAKPVFPTNSGVDDELVQRKFTFLFGEICKRIRQ